MKIKKFVHMNLLKLAIASVLMVAATNYSYK